MIIMVKHCMNNYPCMFKNNIFQILNNFSMKSLELNVLSISVFLRIYYFKKML